ncbi:unnamed protein product, partial [Mesorhabditis belari]|uniref:C2HC/C3H-type domain-containing protein n=1 Tax=Mesorhabditis belari TaxID=2138241 RepID=A0AAF3JB13_9BILA
MGSRRPETAMPESDEPTYACKVCGRQFVRSSLDKHEPVCKKLTNMNRKIFDSGKQRATGSDINIGDVRRAQKEREQNGGQFNRPKTQWRQRHTDFIEAISASKKVDYALKTGAPLPPPPKTSVPSDYVQCEYCGRNFNERAAERHVPFCREQHAKKPMTKTMIKPLSAHRPLPTADQAKTRDGRRDTRTRSDSRTRDEPRRKSIDSRPPKTSSNRPVAGSAGVREIPPVTPNRRSNSAPRTPAQPSRLKAPPGGRKSNHKYSPPRTSRERPPKTPKTSNGLMREAPKTREGWETRDGKTRDRSRTRDGLKTRDGQYLFPNNCPYLDNE